MKEASRYQFKSNGFSPIYPKGRIYRWFHFCTLFRRLGSLQEATTILGSTAIIIIRIIIINDKGLYTFGDTHEQGRVTRVSFAMTSLGRCNEN